MHITTDYDLSFDKEQYISFRGEKFAALLDEPAIKKKFDTVFEEAKYYCQPSACYDYFSIKEIRHNSIKLDNDVSLGAETVLEIIGGAKNLVLAVCTVGELIDKRLKELRSNKEVFMMMILDELASWGLDQVRFQVLENISQECESRGLRTSSCLSPGESEWSVKEQRKIFQLLSTSKIGVELRSQYVMTPLKSISLLVGVSDSPMGEEDMSNCDFCSMKDRCKYKGFRVS